MDFDSEDEIRRELDQDEVLLWFGQPRQGLVLRVADIFFIPFSLMWGGFAIFWEVMVFFTSAPWFFRLWGIPFIAVGLYMIFGRFWVDIRTRAATYYGVTSERVIIITRGWSRRVQSLDIRMAELTLNEQATGGGTILFGAVPAFYPFWYVPGIPFGGSIVVPSFELSSDARAIFEIIRKAQRSAQKDAEQ